LAQDEIIQIQLTDAGTQSKVIVGDNTTVKANTPIPVLVRRSAVQEFIDKGLVEQVPATTAIPLNSVFADIEVVSGKGRISVPIGPKKEQDSIVTKTISDGVTTQSVETVTPETNYYPVTLIIAGNPTEFCLDYPRFSSSTDRYPDSLSYATIRTVANPDPLPLDHLDQYKDEIVLNPGQILNCKLNPKIVELEAKGLIQLSNITVTPANVPTPQTSVGPSPISLPFPPTIPSPMFMYVDFWGVVNSAPTFPIS
jgi:hypothetical protein